MQFLGFFRRIEIGDRYLTRWHVIPRNPVLNIYLHRFTGSDQRTPHDHPWWSVSVLLRGRMIERFIHRPSRVTPVYYLLKREIPWLWPVLRSPNMAHYLELRQGPVWTLFVTGPRLKSWGFWTVHGWVDFATYLGGTRQEYGRKDGQE